eukprot:1238969-Pyramimonas_sp.AAC.1
MAASAKRNHRSYSQPLNLVRPSLLVDPYGRVSSMPMPPNTQSPPLRERHVSGERLVEQLSTKEMVSGPRLALVPGICSQPARSWLSSRVYALNRPAVGSRP